MVFLVVKNNSMVFLVVKNNSTPCMYPPKVGARLAQKLKIDIT